MKNEHNRRIIMTVKLSKKVSNLVLLLMATSITTSILIAIYKHSWIELISGVILFVAICIIGIKSKPEINIIDEIDT